ncbi:MULTISPECIES: ferredoxin-type protein NapF [unclassified Mannheimia]|uniref:ferredoxin-type protein NapF n=1 Tax=unclassified Mannheimia TaxID=2645054 RepID=UPI00359E3395
MQARNEQYYEAYLSHKQISRRRLFRTLFNSVDKGQKEYNARLAHRPPFAAEEHLFLVACTGCGDCTQACPHNLIQIQQKKAVLELDYMSCSLCGKCAESCSTNALNIAFKRDTGLRPSVSNECLVKQNQLCTMCQDQCSQQAISSNLMVNNELCNGCGECKISCFLSAIQLV